MNKKFTTFLLFIISVTFLVAQNSETVTIDYGQSYSKQVFYQLETGNTQTFNNEDWDLAFTTEDGVLGIHLNEASTFMQESDHLFEILTAEFSDVFTEDNLDETELYNTEDSWAQGAFNETRDTIDADDYGWGLYNASTGEIEDVRYFAIHMRNGDWKKIKISYSDDTYHVTYADFDNMNEHSFEIKKSDFPKGKLALLSIENDKLLDPLDNWDLFFGRYSAGIVVNDEIVPYTVLGVLTNGDVKIAQLDDVDQSSTVSDASEFNGLWINEIDAIGHDWKDFDLNAGGWVIHDNVVYYAKKGMDVYKLVFSRFGGSSDGSMDFEKTKLDIQVGNQDMMNNTHDLSIFPNPIQDGNVVFGFELPNNQVLNMKVMNSLGQVIWSSAQKGNAGFNVKSIHFNGISNGVYTLLLESERGYSVKKFIVSK